MLAVCFSGLFLIVPVHMINVTEFTFARIRSLVMEHLYRRKESGGSLLLTQCSCPTQKFSRCIRRVDAKSTAATSHGGVLIESIERSTAQSHRPSI